MSGLKSACHSFNLQYIHPSFIHSHVHYILYDATANTSLPTTTRPCRYEHRGNEGMNVLDENQLNVKTDNDRICLYSTDDFGTLSPPAKPFLCGKRQEPAWSRSNTTLPKVMRGGACTNSTLNVSFIHLANGKDWFTARTSQPASQMPSQPLRCPASQLASQSGNYLASQ